MFIAASTECWPELSLDDAIPILWDMEFTAIEIDVHEQGGHLRPSEVHADPDRIATRILQGHRLDIAAYSVQIDAQGPLHYEIFKSMCRLAKSTKVVTLVVPSAELGTPFNEEVEHLQRLVDVASADGIRVGVRSQIGRLSEDPDTLMVLCDNVDGLGVTLDPSVYVAGPHRNKSIDKILKYIYHVHLRDSKKDKFQVAVGQGEVDYSKVIQQLEKVDYDRSLCVHIAPMPEVDHRVELRKLRRLLESML
jgi:sugar phosphate isomerase/epimerase